MIDIMRILLIVTALLSSLHADVAPTIIHARPADIDALLGNGLTGKFVYVRKRSNFSNECLYYIDFSDSVYSERKVCDIDSVNSPRISPDGTSLLFWYGRNQASDTSPANAIMYACAFTEDATPVKIGAGYDPRWWVDPVEGSTYVIYTSNNFKANWPQPGQTKIQQIDPVSYALIDSARTVIDHAFKGGLSKNGRYICTAYSTIDIFDLIKGRHYQLNEGSQGCQPSISPSSDPSRQGRMMFLDIVTEIDGVEYGNHEVITVRDTSDSIVWFAQVPSGRDRWERPEWATHEDFCTAVAPSTAAELYLINMKIDDVYQVATGRFGDSHLWVGNRHVSASDEGRGYKSPVPFIFSVMGNPVYSGRSGAVVSYSVEILDMGGTRLFYKDINKTMASYNWNGNTVTGNDIVSGVYVLKVQYGMETELKLFTLF